MYERIIHHAFRPLELSGINKSHFSSRHSTRWLFFPLFPLELRMFVLVEGGKPEDPEKNSRSNDKNQQQTQPTCLISLYNYFFGSQHKTHDLLKNATHLYLKSTHPAPHMSAFIMIFNGLWVRAMPQGPYHNSHYFSSVAHFSLANLIKLTLCFAGRKPQFDSQPFACHPLNAFVCLCLLVK